MRPQESLLFISTAIQVRDNHSSWHEKELVEKLIDLSEFGVLSNRQLAKLCNNKVSSTKIKRVVGKTSKEGGLVNPEDFEKMRLIVFSTSGRKLDETLISEVTSNGTSQGMLSKITGIPQSTISRKVRNGFI